MVEHGPRIREAVATGLQPPVERGSQRFSLENRVITGAFIGEAVGAIAIPGLHIGVTGIFRLTEAISNLPSPEISPTGALLVSEAVLGLMVGGFIGGIIASATSK